MHPPDPKIADLLPRIVERAARRSDEKEEEPWVKLQKNAGESDAAPPAAWLPAGASLVLLGFVFFPAMLAFVVTGVTGRDNYLVEGAPNSQPLYCSGAPLVHTVHFAHLGNQTQFFAGALLINGLMWVAVAGAIWWSLHAGTSTLLAYGAEVGGGSRSANCWRSASAWPWPSAPGGGTWRPICRGKRLWPRWRRRMSGVSRPAPPSSRCFAFRSWRRRTPTWASAVLGCASSRADCGSFASFCRGGRERTSRCFSRFSDGIGGQRAESLVPSTPY